MSVNWSEFDKLGEIINPYIPDMGEGETMASQACTAVSKLVYKWYNDGDVYDNTNGLLDGWMNDLSSYANWLRLHSIGTKMDGVFGCRSESDYEDLLYDIALTIADEGYLNWMAKRPKVDSIYSCDGPYKFVEPEEDDDEWW